MAPLPVEPKLARAILASKILGCTLEVLDIVSVLSASSNLFIDIADHRDDTHEARMKFRHPSGDHLTIMNVLRAFHGLCASESETARKSWCRKHFINERTLVEAIDIRNQIRDTCSRIGIDWNISCNDAEQPVLQSLVRGLVQNTAFLEPDGAYKQVMGPSIVKICPGSVLHDKKVHAIVYDDLVYTSQTYARGVSAVSKSLIIDSLATRQ